MKAYLLIAKEKNLVSQERFNDFLMEYKRIYNDFDVKKSIYDYVVRRINKAYQKCLEDDFEYEMGKSKYPLNNDEILLLAQSVFSIHDIARIQLKEYPIIENNHQYDNDGFIRNGILFELRKEYKKAFECYDNTNSKLAIKRAYLMKKLQEKENHKNYLLGMKLYKAKDYDGSFYPLMLSADNSCYKASIVIGEMLIKSLGCRRDIEEGLSYLVKAFNNMSSKIEASKMIYKLYDEGYLIGIIDNDKINYYISFFSNKKFIDKSPLDLLKIRANKGNVYCMLRIGLESNDLEEQIKYLKMASDKNSVQASLRLSEITNESEFYLIKAANDGSIEACDKLIELYKESQDKALKYLKIGADLQDGLKAFEYAKILEEQGNDPIHYYEIAGNKGISEALIRLYKIYKNGEFGNDIDEIKANQYLFKSGLGRD